METNQGQPESGRRELNINEFDGTVLASDFRLKIKLKKKNKNTLYLGFALATVKKSIRGLFLILILLFVVTH